MRKAVPFKSPNSHVNIFWILLKNNFPLVWILVTHSDGDPFYAKEISWPWSYCPKWSRSVFLGNHRAACTFILETGFLAIHANFKVKCSPALASLSLHCWFWLLFSVTCTSSSWRAWKAFVALFFILHRLSVSTTSKPSWLRSCIVNELHFIKKKSLEKEKKRYQSYRVHYVTFPIAGL